MIPWSSVLTAALALAMRNIRIMTGLLLIIGAFLSLEAKYA